jgi:hypothetical protein
LIPIWPRTLLTGAQFHSWATVATAGLAVVAFAGFLGVPALLHTLGVGAQSGLCPLCQFPVPSSAPVPHHRSRRVLVQRGGLPVSLDSWVLQITLDIEAAHGDLPEA